MWTRMRARLARFGRENEGMVSIEMLFFMPLVMGILVATFSLHDAFRYKSLNVKAAYTISDALSRETDPIDNAYLDGMIDLMQYLTRSSGTYSLRVSQVRWDKKKNRYIVDWSKTRGDFNRLITRDLKAMTDQLPTLLHNERVVVVETTTLYTPPFVVPGLPPQEFYNYGFTRPRFAPKLVWSSG